MAYRIKEIAEMMGITPQTLRFYEQYGMLPSSRSGEGGYRSYSDANVDVLMSLRNLRNCGYSVAQTVDLLARSDLKEQSRTLLAQAERLERRIEMERRIVEKLRVRARWMEQAPERIGTLEERKSPALLMRVFAHGKGKLLPKDRAALGRWTEWMPLVQWARVFEPAQERLSVRQGYVVDPETAAFLNVGAEPEIVRLPPRHCLYAVLCWYPRKNQLEAQVTALLERLRTHGIEPIDNPFVRTFWNAGLQEDQHSYGEAWLPVNPSDALTRFVNVSKNKQSS